MRLFSRYGATIVRLLAAAGALAATARAQEPAWTQAAGPFPARGTLAVDESASSQLHAAGDRLVRRRAGTETELRCTDPGGTGEILDLAADPAGLVFVAAARGLFVVSPEVGALDRVRLQDGAPPGSPRSVFVDARRRVWIATDVAVGVVDPSFGWGRTLALGDGLPRAGRPYRLAGEPDGALLVETAAGVSRYRPDQGPGPVVTRVVVNGETFEPGGKLKGVHGASFDVAAEGSAGGVATFRLRLDRDHVWRALGEPIEVPAGEHVLEVIAIDRDLRRSAPVAVPIACELPPQYEKGFVLRVGALVVVLVTGLFAWRARRSRTPDQSRAEPWVRAPVSAALAIGIGVQVLAGLVPHAKGWPFIGFSMYTNTYDEGWIIYDGGVFGIEPGGRARKIDYHGVVPFADDRWQVIGPIIDGDADFAREWVRRYNALHPGEAIVGLQTRADRRRLTSAGPVPIAPLVFSSYRGPEATDGCR